MALCLQGNKTRVFEMGRERLNLKMVQFMKDSSSKVNVGVLELSVKHVEVRSIKGIGKKTFHMDLEKSNGKMGRDFQVNSTEGD